MSDVKILLASPHAGYEQRLRQAFGGTLNGELQRWKASAASVSELPQQVDDARPDVVAIGPGLPLDDALGLAAWLEAERPEICVLLIAESTPELWQQALRTGARDILSPTAGDAEVRASFERVLAVAQRRRDNLLGTDDTGPAGRIVTLLSPKGGSGKTTVATNLALGLAHVAKGEVVLVDLDLQFGDVATALRLTPEQSIADAARAGGALDTMALKALLTPHPSGLWALCGADNPAEGDAITPELATTVVRLLADEFPYVIVDTSAGLTEHTLSVIEASTDLLLVCAMDVPSVRSVHKEITVLDALGLATQRRWFVLNRAGSKVGIEAEDIEATVGLPVDVAVPSNRALPLSFNTGSPVLESEPRSPAARQLSELVTKFAPQTSDKSSPSLLPWRRSSR